MVPLTGDLIAQKFLPVLSTKVNVRQPSVHINIEHVIIYTQKAGT